LIWYIVLGGIGLAISAFGMSFTAGREKASTAAKPAKEKNGFCGKKK